MLWKVRFKHKQMMDTHVIETVGETQAEADELAEAYLGEEFGTPNIRLVPPVLPFVSRRTMDVPALAAKYGAPRMTSPESTTTSVDTQALALTVPAAETTTENTAAAVPPRSGEPTTEPAADGDDEMTQMAGPPTANAKGRNKPGRVGA